MAQNLTVGRAGLATTVGGDGLELVCDQWSQEGDEASVAGFIRRQSTVADAKALRDQLAGYGPLNTDELVVPVTWSEDSTRDGFYRVMSVDTSNELTGRLGSPSEAGGNLAYRFTADLSRVPNFQAPMWEKICAGATRSGGAATGVTWASYPSTATLVQHANNGAGSVVTLEAELADVVFTYHASTFYNETILQTLAPSTFYQVASKIERSVDNGTTFRTVTGKQILNDPTSGWRIGNGLVRVSYGTTLDVEMWNDGAGAWQSKSYKAVSNGVTATSLGTPDAVTILRNAPEICSVRLSWSVLDTPRIVVYCDLTIRQGQPWVEGYLSTMAGATKALGVFRSATEAGTSFTGGIEATSDDGSSNKYRIHCKTTGVTKDTTNGGAYLSSAGTNFPFAICNDIQGLTNTTESTYYCAAMEHRLSLVGV